MLINDKFICRICGIKYIFNELSIKEAHICLNCKYKIIPDHIPIQQYTKYIDLYKEKLNEM